ncbi:MAG TPA: Ig-like domain-containing protein [Desulfobacteraceae bacterium]|nr:Ig-like domain-containing protein [Desulfobacteraceae bacterium]HPJ66489.1 Ig-like domain-containing protein [Desulfobacteraceae bacterium]HPQ28223.1 Ig-like domain-containing protein [Desulfobacteraceae bacterium]
MFSKKRVMMLTILGVFFLAFLTQNALGAGPFGTFQTPLSGSTVRGVVQVTGWALDDVQIASVRVYRMDGSNSVYMGDANLIEGARPDIAAAYPEYPYNWKAGWGYSLVTNLLPNGGNGTFTLIVTATDSDGNNVTLGTKNIICDNANAVKPFGDLDAPIRGETVSGSAYTVSGWALTPQPNTIPTDGSTISVYIDGVMVGHPLYNMYRSDIAAAFPAYNNSNGAGGFSILDTTAYADGVHTVFWTARDNAGNTDGIGSRYFIIQNGPAVTAPAVITANITSVDTTTASCGGNVISDGNNAVTERGVCWSTSDHPLITDSRTIDGAGTGAYTSTLTGLSPDTTYYVRAYAINSKGISYGNDVILRALSIPILNKWGMIIIAVMLLGASFWMMRRKRQDMV